MSHSVKSFNGLPMIDASFLDQLSKFHLIINKRVTSNYIGQKKSSAAGRGLTFKDYRIYAPGDDFFYPM